ncbi:MAG: hypothetical protein C4527_24805 [Candidatus Omnitrophota bacterium]|jgi:hypothetical protein|nr:MAG: hypothetical protein C4527_24805 [Candidatus Omnitrophota bacterium]
MEDTIDNVVGNRHYDPLTLTETLILAVCTFPFSLMLLLSFPYTFILISIVGIWFLFYRSLRIHGVIILLPFIYLFINVNFSDALPGWQHMFLPKIVGSIGFYLLPYIPQSIPDLFLIITYFWAIFLSPIVGGEVLYWLARFRCWKSLAMTVFVAVIVAHAALAYGDRCVDSYNKVEAFRGRILPAAELFEHCGHPVYQELYRGPVGKTPHWVYTNGDHVIPLTVDENGMAEVHNNTYFFFD